MTETTEARAAKLHGELGHLTHMWVHEPQLRTVAPRRYAEWLARRDEIAAELGIGGAR